MQKTSDQPYNFIWNNLKDLLQFPTFDVSEHKEKFASYLNHDYVNYSLGAMFGAFIGDALGSYLEFSGKVNKFTVDEAMLMEGGGVFKLQPAQFTDDSQMASHMLKALCSYDPKVEFQHQSKLLVKNIAIQYKQWFESGPFDIGITTRIALHHIRQAVIKIQKENKGEVSTKSSISGSEHIQQAFGHIDIKNSNSQSNGSLMRITPMAFFIGLIMRNKHIKEVDTFKELIQNQIHMTHGNSIIMKASQEWVKILVKIILRKQKGYEQSLRDIHENFIESNNNSVIKQWIDQCKSTDFMKGVNSMGWAKIAFTWGLQHMESLIKKKQKTYPLNQQVFESQDYKEILYQVLLGGGDTDTNGAIVGGLIGAIVGFKNLPIQYLKKQFNLRIEKPKEKREYSNYEPRLQFLRAMDLINRIIESNQQEIVKHAAKEQESCAPIEQKSSAIEDLVSTCSFQQSQINEGQQSKLSASQYFKASQQTCLNSKIYKDQANSKIESQVLASTAEQIVKANEKQANPPTQN